MIIRLLISQTLKKEVWNIDKNNIDNYEMSISATVTTLRKSTNRHPKKKRK